MSIKTIVFSGAMSFSIPCKDSITVIPDKCSFSNCDLKETEATLTECIYCHKDFCSNHISKCSALECNQALCFNCSTKCSFEGCENVFCDEHKKTCQSCNGVFCDEHINNHGCENNYVNIKLTNVPVENYKINLTEEELRTMFDDNSINEYADLSLDCSPRVDGTFNLKKTGDDEYSCVVKIQKDFDLIYTKYDEEFDFESDEIKRKINNVYLILCLQYNCKEDKNHYWTLTCEYNVANIEPTIVDLGGGEPDYNIYIEDKGEDLKYDLKNAKIENKNGEMNTDEENVEIIETHLIL